MQTNKDVNTSYIGSNSRINQNLVTRFGLILFVIVVFSVFFGNYLSNSRIPRFNTIENAKLNLSFYYLDLKNKSSQISDTKNKSNAFKQAQNTFKNLLNNKSWDNIFYPTLTKPQILTVNQILKQLKQNELYYKNKKNNIALHQADFDALMNNINNFQVSLYQRHFELIKKFRNIQLVLFLIFLIYIIVFYILYKKDRKKNSNLISNQEQIVQELERKNYFLKKSQFIANIGYYYYDFKTNLWTASEFILKLINFNKGKYPLDMWINIIHPDDRTILTDVLKKRLYNPKVVLDVTYRIINPKNGNIHWMHHFARAIEQNKDGENLPIVGIVQDITTQKENDVRLNRFNQIMESTLNEIYIVDYKNLTFIEVNDAVLFNLNYTKSEILKLKLADVAPDISPEKIDELRLKLTTKKTVIFETYHKRKDGSTYPVEVHLQKGKQDDVNVFFIIVLDISERKNTLKKLEDSDDRWKFAIEGTNDGLWDMNYKTNEIYYSKRWKEMLGYSDHELENKVETWRKLVHPDDLERVEFTSHLHFDNKTPNYAAEYRMLCKDGTYKWILDRGKVVSRDKAGKPARVIGVHTDISERKALEKALFQKSQMLSNHMNHTPLAAIYTDTNSVIKEWNKAAEEMFAYTEEEALGKNLVDLIVPDNYKTDVKEICDELIAEKGGNISHNINQAKNGSILNCIWYNTLIKDENDKPIGFASLVDNVTKQKALEETIKQIANLGSYNLNLLTYKATISDTFAKITGLKNGSNEIDFKKDWRSIVFKDDVEENQKMLDHCIKTGEKFDREYRILTFDNKELKWVRGLGKVIYKENVPISFVGTIQDITHDKMAELALKESERKLKEAEKIAQLGSFVFNDGTNKFETSKIFDKIAGIDKNYIKDINGWKNLIHPDDYDKIQNKLDDNSIESLSEEVRIIRPKDNKTIWVLAHAKKEFDKNNVRSLITGTIQDITEKRKLERGFMQAFIEAQEHEKQNFGENLHDGLGQILTTESMYIDLLLNMPNNKDEKTIEFLSKIKELNLSAIHDTRGIAHGLMSKQLKEKGLIMAIDQICKDYNNSKNIQFHFEYKGLEEHEIIAEIKTQLYRIVQEISTNIVRHSEATEAGIHLHKINTNKLELIIEDNGIGINLDKVKKMEKGVGLVNIERRVKLLNGTVTINTEKNKGTKYNVIVPLANI